MPWSEESARGLWTVLVSWSYGSGRTGGLLVSQKLGLSHAGRH